MLPEIGEQKLITTIKGEQAERLKEALEDDCFIEYVVKDGEIFIYRS